MGVGWRGGIDVVDGLNSYFLSYPFGCLIVIGG